MRLLLLATAFLFVGCSTQRYFVPRENVNGTGPGGHPAAVYPLDAAPAKGEVRVWSGGAHLVEAEAGDVVELQVGFELENTGGEPLVIDVGALQCADVWVDGQRLAVLPPARVEGQAEAPVGGSASLQAWFRPVATRPRDLDGFSLRFSVRGGDRTVLTQVVPFVPFVRSDRWYDDHFFWYGGYRDGPFWGPGFGYGWYGHYRCR